MAKRGYLIGGALAVLAALGLYIIVCLGFWVLSSGRAYPGVTVAGLNISGKNKEQMVEALKKQPKPQKITISGVSFKPTDISLRYDYEKTTEQALAIGQDNPFLLGGKRALGLKTTFDTGKLEKILRGIEKQKQKTAINPRTDGRQIRSGQRGIRLNYAETSENLRNSLGELHSRAEASFFEVAPAYQPEALSGEAAEQASRLPEEFLLTGLGKEYPVPKTQLFSWLGTNTNQLSRAKLFDGEPLLEPLFGLTASPFNMNEIEGYLNELSKEINTPPTNARLKAENGKVVVAVAEKNGAALNISETAEEIALGLESQKNGAELIIEIEKPEIRTDNLSELGISELVSVGSSNFTGSPVNRIHNVRTGASKFNGVIIKQGEEFSFNKILGPVDASTGYKPELVILENKTQPQFGGGLCQVSSTAFRAALNAGFPILERRAHAYPVTYYKPFGVDATIYLPKPDFRFRNDSPGQILIQTRIVGRNLYFDFYGTKSSRSVKFAGNANATGAVPIVERVNPYIYDQGKRGNRSFSAMFYRFIYDTNGKLIGSKYFISKYDSPDKYPH